MEAVISIDVLRRGGIDVTVAGVDGAAPIRCSRGVVVTPDVALDEVEVMLTVETRGRAHREEVLGEGILRLEARDHVLRDREARSRRR